ncbi:Hsp20 family protein [Altererythrobacter arenosus]|uniref:Hsp20 family protein n=1 Tax=Altererythrobacter arenosus TaxID=3032592 RepID=A0ABY8FS13_9SPHN|nr:Hsp20 family protein [Altererythrobacter sp. CAU 1644]WFL77803.1 Hsp20 family protein [Altererythrobacter sp. CAU 1644]
MRTAFDLAPYRRSTVGFDRLFDALERSTRVETQDGYPPFDIARTGEDSYRITLAVAGFSPDEIDITAQQNQLVISGEKADKDEEGVEIIHRGIAMRAFERRFQLADYVEVRDASYENGMLTVSLERVVPEAMKPRKIEIGTSGNDNTPQLTKDKAA